MAVQAGNAKIEVIDVHTHIGAGYTVRSALQYTHRLGRSEDVWTADDMIREMERFDVDMVVAFPLTQVTTNYDAANRVIAEAMNTYPERIVGVARVNPHWGEEQTRRDMRRFIREYGLRGFKLHPVNDAFPPNNRKLVAPVYETAAELGVPIIIHTGESLPWGSPSLVAELASEYPTVPIIMSHLGLFEWADEAISAAARYPNLYLDTSTFPIVHTIIRAVERVGISKVLYGSDAPWQPFGLEIEKLTRFCGFGLSELEMILAGNARRLFKLEGSA